MRGGSVETVELRASMIVGHGSLSWLIVRDLAARLPFMVLPRWLESRTQPVAIDDVVGRARGRDRPRTEDLLARDERFWALIGHPHRSSFAEAAGRALEAERGDRPIQGIWCAIERARLSGASR